MIKNWKTTLTGVISAVVIVVVKLLISHTVDADTIVIAASVAALGFLSSDAQLVSFIKANPLADEGLELANAIASALAANNPNSELFKAIHETLGKLNDNVNALPAAVAAALPAPTVNVAATVEAPPVIEEVKPVDITDQSIWKFNPLTGKVIKPVKAA